MNNFTIIIPTYNRKERLLKVLNSIYSQRLSKEIDIIILDNNSNYNVESTINIAFDKATTSNTKVIRHPVNIGGALNIAMPFYFCRTKWLWIMSDDDLSECNALEIIKDDIAKNDNVAILKYSFLNCEYDDDVISSVDEMFKYKKNHGDFWNIVYCSNAVYNVERMNSIIGDIIEYSYNSIAAAFALILTLDRHLGDVILRRDRIVKYVVPESGTGWNDLKLVLRVSSFLDYHFELDGKSLKRLWYRGVDSFPHFMDTLEKNNLYIDKAKCIIYYKKVFPFLFQDGIWRRVLYRILFYVYLLTGKNLVPTLLKMIGR